MVAIGLKLAFKELSIALLCGARRRERERGRKGGERERERGRVKGRERGREGQRVRRKEKISRLSVREREMNCQRAHTDAQIKLLKYGQRKLVRRERERERREREKRERPRAKHYRQIITIHSINV